MIPVREDLPTTVEEAEAAGWVQIGSGMARWAFTHPDFPGKVLKIECRYLSCNEDEVFIWESLGDTAFGWSFAPIFARSPCSKALLVKFFDGGNLHLDDQSEDGDWDCPEGHPVKQLVDESSDYYFFDLHSGNVRSIGDGRFVIIDYAGMSSETLSRISGRS